MARTVKRMTKKGETSSTLSMSDAIQQVVSSENDSGRKRLNNAEKALIKQYKIHHPDELVPNTLKELLNAEFPYIKKMVESLELYSDPDVYRVLPTELDNFIREYNMIIIQSYYMGRNARVIPVIVAPENYKRCSCCGKYKNADKFYNFKTDSNDGSSCICSDCANDIFKNHLGKHGNLKEALIYTAMKIDLFVYQPMIEKYLKYFDTVEGKEKLVANKFFSAFVADTVVCLALVSELKDKNLSFAESNFSGIPLKSTTMTDAPKIYDEWVQNSETVDDEGLLINTEDMKKMAVLRDKWGTDDDNDIRWLEKRYKRWTDGYNINDLSREVIVKQLCLEELNINQRRSEGADVSKQLKNFQDLLKTSELSPKQISKSDMSNQIDNIGTLIKKVEKSGPIIAKSKEFEDVDGIRRLWRSMCGALSQTLLQNNSLVDEMKENYKDCIIDMEEINGSTESDK